MHCFGLAKTTQCVTLLLEACWIRTVAYCFRVVSNVALHITVTFLPEVSVNLT
jgi:hypothetical protein